MALNTLVVGLLVCGLVATAIAYAELNAWRGLTTIALYTSAGFITSELVAAPLMWDLFALPAGWLESAAMTIALAVALYQIGKLATGGNHAPD